MTAEVLETGTGADPAAVAEPLAIATAPGSTAIVTAAPTEKQSQAITYFLGAALLLLVVAYFAIPTLAILVPPRKSAYDIVTAAQKGIADFILIIASALAGAIAQKHT